MRKILIPLIIVLAVGGYWFYWNKKAQDFQLMLTQSIAQVNEQYKGLNQDSPVIRYEAIEHSGFPFALTLTITKPVLDVPVSAILQHLPRGNGMPVAAAPSAGQPKDWVEEISYGRSIELSGNMLGDSFTLKVDGDSSSVSLIDHTPRHTRMGSSATPMVCHLALGRKDNALWSMEPVFTDWPGFLNAFRAFDCSIQGVTLKNADGAQLVSFKDFTVSASAKPASNGYNSVTFITNVKSALATPAYDAMAQEYAQLLGAFLQMPQPQMIPPSAYGEQNIAIDIRYDGPTTGAMLADPAMRLKLDVNAFTLESALLNFKEEMHIASAPEGENRTASAALHGSLTASERYDQLTAQQAAAAYGEMAKKAGTMPVTPQAMAGAIPKLHDLGTVAWDIDASAKGLNQGLDAFLRQGSITLSAFDVVATPYGVKLKGDLTSAPKKMPAGELTATCLSCDALVGDAVNYLNRVKAAFVDLAQSAPFTPQFTDGVRHFLHALAEKADAKDLVIHILAKDTGEITVSGKQVTEVLGLYMSDIAPNLPHPPQAQEKPAVRAKH